MVLPATFKYKTTTLQGTTETIDLFCAHTVPYLQF